MLRVLPLALALLLAAASVAEGKLYFEEPKPERMSLRQKAKAMDGFVRSSIECVAKVVDADERYRTQPHKRGDLIVEAVGNCYLVVRTMVNRYDRYFGEGVGEVFLMGPFLDLLPHAVRQWISEHGTGPPLAEY